MDDILKTAIITVNYRTANLVIQLIESLKGELNELGNTHLFVVDNNSGDDSVDLLTRYILKNNIDWVTVLASEINGGFAAGNNVAIKYLQDNYDSYEYLWFINPDTTIESGAGVTLASFLNINDKDIVGSQMIDLEGNIQHSSFNFPGIISELCNGARINVLDTLFANYLVARREVKVPELTDWLSGASFMVTKRFVDRVGCLDSQYFLYFEEVDYFFRAKEYGFEVWHVPESRVVHIVGASTGIKVERRRRAQYWFDSRRRYFLKNHSIFKLILADTAFVVGYMSWCLRKLLTRSPELQKEPVYFLRDFIKNSFLFRGWKIHR